MRPMIRHSVRLCTPRLFSTSHPHLQKNRVYTTIRRPDELSTLLLLSSSSNVPLITYWAMSWQSQGKDVMVKSLIEDEGVGEAEGGVGYVEVEMDAPTIDNLDIQYGINAVPTILAFSRSEPQFSTKLTKTSDINNKQNMRSWIEKEAKRGGQGGAGGSFFDLLGKSAISK
ncbi:hypothetical protein E2P81_ATG03877 [Venturia nashicola]|uniref:Thioredoxin domain-containing protein n=1 Tax=Venturia nashicola TaxID=86259 RepID=A0A4Z1PBW4_9PEZI|nr:hypothetical protein E6O75_ATG03968 [Venturia nashicola]TLD38202.1 hypothetical protein E2P81_ATG03877 [Venturia nashicola]